MSIVRYALCRLGELVAIVGGLLCRIDTTAIQCGLSEVAYAMQTGKIGNRRRSLASVVINAIV
ncbi:hypothetical protein [Novipirellula rosea]|uniref:hypothetical protein n=1 Tax=Novipirellula rosea TaxID=1031540 RepID=UPI0031E881D3